MYGQDSPGVVVIDPTANRNPAALPPIFADIKSTGNGGGVPQAFGGAYQLFNNLAPSSDDFDKLLNPIGAVDVVWWRYWDSVALTSAGATNTNLFTSVKTNLYDGNLIGANGTLQGTEKFLVKAIRIELECDSTTNPLDAVDVEETLRLMVVTFWVQNKPYAQFHGLEFLDPIAPLLLNTNYYQQNPFKTLPLGIDVPIGTRSSFYVNLNTTSPTLSGTWRAKCYLIGVLYRGVQ